MKKSLRYSSAYDGAAVEAGVAIVSRVCSARLVRCSAPARCDMLVLA